jgi:hypothetical protein
MKNTLIFFIGMIALSLINIAHAGGLAVDQSPGSASTAGLSDRGAAAIINAEDGTAPGSANTAGLSDRAAASKLNSTEGEAPGRTNTAGLSDRGAAVKLNETGEVKRDTGS